jgi:protein-disulfide isomerase
MSRPATIPQSRRERRAVARQEAAERPRRSNRPRRPGSRPAWQSPMAIATLGAVVLGVALVALAFRPAGRPTGAQLAAGPTTYSAGLTRGTVLGSASAPVVIDLYADFQCPVCRDFVTVQLPRLVTDYVNPGIVRIQAHDIDILGKGTPDESLELATGAACAAEQDRYWPFHDLVFWNQRRENRGDHDAAFISSVAAQAGLDVSAWNACNARADVRQTIGSATRVAAGSGIQATPTLVVNGQRLVGLPVYSQLTALIDRLAAPGS